MNRMLAVMMVLLPGAFVPGADSKSKDVQQLTVKITSSRDNTEQNALFWRPDSAAGAQGTPAPLLVGLHTWSNHFDNAINYVSEAKKRGWVIVAPDFRGPNNRPEACASELAIQDILDAVEYAKKNARVDESRIYLVGGSGGGHMALMMAAKAPAVWAGVSSWVPISDLAAWHEQTKAAKRNYWKMLEQSCGGPPGPETLAQYRARSPLFHLPAAKAVPLDINTGIHDGHTGSVPVSHSINAFNVLAEASGQKDKRVSAGDIEFMCRERKVPLALAAEKQADPERKKTMLFRRIAGSARITVFEGGHEQETTAALEWLSRQKKGAAADFSLHKAKATGGAEEVPK